MAIELDLAELKRICSNDLLRIMGVYDNWYRYNQKRKNWLFIISIVVGASTSLAAAILPGPELKICAAALGFLSTVAAALQRFSRLGAKAEFYGGQVKEIHVLWLDTQAATTEAELREILKKYAAILLEEGKLSRDQDDNRRLNEEVKEFKDQLKTQKKP